MIGCTKHYTTAIEQLVLKVHNKFDIQNYVLTSVYLLKCNLLNITCLIDYSHIQRILVI